MPKSILFFSATTLYILRHLCVSPPSSSTSNIEQRFCLMPGIAPKGARFALYTLSIHVFFILLFVLFFLHILIGLLSDLKQPRVQLVKHC